MSYWAKHLISCAGCGTVERAHKAAGYCTACYMRCYIRSGRQKKKWSRIFDRCQNCGGTKSKHRGGGFCHLCYKAKDRSKRYQMHGAVNNPNNDWPDDPITFKAGDRVMHKGYPGLVRGETGRGDIVIVLDGAVWHVPAGELVRA